MAKISKKNLKKVKGGIDNELYYAEHAEMYVPTHHTDPSVLAEYLSEHPEVERVQKRVNVGGQGYYITEILIK